MTFMHIACNRRPLPVPGKFQQVVVELMLSERVERPPVRERGAAVAQNRIHPVVFSCN